GAAPARQRRQLRLGPGHRRRPHGSRACPEPTYALGMSRGHGRLQRSMDRMQGATATADEGVAAMGRDGYCVVEHLLPPEQVASIKADLDRILDDVPYGRNDFEGHQTKRLYNIFAKTRVLDDVALHPLLLGVLDQVLRHYQLSAPVGIRIGPGNPAQVIHTDDSIYPLPWPHDEVVVNSMWAIDDFTEANGATRVVPGSHRRASAAQPDDKTT